MEAGLVAPAVASRESSVPVSVVRVRNVPMGMRLLAMLVPMCMQQVTKWDGTIVNIRLPARRSAAQKREDDLNKMVARRAARRERRQAKAWAKLGTTPQEHWANRNRAIPPSPSSRVSKKIWQFINGLWLVLSFRHHRSGEFRRRRDLLKDWRQCNADGPANGIDRWTRSSSQQCTAAVLLDLDLAEVVQIIDDVLPFKVAVTA